jgi:4-hydroxy-tetrahydrodipicolinate reductase
MKKLHVAVVGANGRMGQEILSALAQDPVTEPTLAVVRKGVAEGFAKTVTDLKAGDFKKIDAVIDFSSTENFENILTFCAQNKLPLVTGTTGLSEAQKKSLLKYSKKTAVLWSPNMSLGVAAVAEALRAFSGLEGFDFQIEEIHHGKKKDRPSGTAVLLQNELKRQVKTALPEPISIRGGGVFGVHRIYAMAENETICIEHTALNRRLFAIGAVRAAKWLSLQTPGLYELKDVVGRK